MSIPVTVTTTRVTTRTAAVAVSMTSEGKVRVDCGEGVALDLDRHAAGNLSGVLRTMADLLEMTAGDDEPPVEEAASADASAGAAQDDSFDQNPTTNVEVESGVPDLSAGADEDVESWAHVEGPPF